MILNHISILYSMPNSKLLYLNNITDTEGVAREAIGYMSLLSVISLFDVLMFTYSDNLQG
jgi:hypothetical protein